MPLTREITLLCHIVHAECWDDQQECLDTGCVRAAAVAFMTLATQGLINIVGQPGRCMRAHWAVDEWETSPGVMNKSIDRPIIDAMLRMADQFRGGPGEEIELDAFSPGLDKWIDALDFLEDVGFVKIVERKEYTVSEQEAVYLVVQKRIPPGDKNRQFPMLKALILNRDGS